MGENIDIISIKDFLKEYSFDDLAKSFFILNLWLPNISSPIKIQFLYVILEHIQENLSNKNKIKSYITFTAFCKKLFLLILSFPILEDYIPEQDWGDIKYYFDRKFYRIFYGGDLSNPYDFYYSFEIIHSTFEKEYLYLLNRSPMSEMKFCLEEQDVLLKTLKQETTKSENNIEPGYIEIPSEKFWKSTCKFIDEYNHERRILPDVFEEYTKEFTGSVLFPGIDVFIENAYHGLNCKYFFIKKGTRYYPCMPRKWLSVIYDKWGALLKDGYENILNRLNGQKPGALIGLKLAIFIRERTNENVVFPLARSINADLNPVHDLIFTAIHAGDKLLLIYVTPPVFNQDELAQNLANIFPKLKQSVDLITNPPARLGLMAEKKIVEFRSPKEGKVLEPIFIIALPSPFSGTELSIALPDDLRAELMTLDQIAGIFDEIEQTIELADFLDYLEAESELARIAPMNSNLDRFGSFKDTYGVLVPGAIEPNRIMLDFSWGSNFRFKSLKNFWKLFPEDLFYGHPRGWVIPEDRRTKTGFILSSKTFFGYAYYQRIGKMSIFINAPVEKMTLEDGRINDLIMHSLFDSIDIYPNIIQNFKSSKSPNKVQVFFCPSFLINGDDFSHLRHLVPDNDLWEMDCTRIRPRDYGIRVVYDKEKIMEALKKVTDRSIQIRLLVDVLEQLNILVLDPNFPKIKKELEKNEDKKARFKTFVVRKTISFPEGIRTILPAEREFKLADKLIAKTALELDIHPGIYSAEEAKIKLNLLRARIVQILNDKLFDFTLGDAIPVLLGKANSLAHDSWQTENEIKATLDHEVDYEREKLSSEKETDFIHWYRVYRYLIEKFVHLQPKGNKELNDNELKKLLAFTNRLLDLYTASDFIKYEIYPVNVNIDDYYIVSTMGEINDITALNKEYGEEQAKLNLGIIGNKSDRVGSRLSKNEYWDELDHAFKKDFNFGFKNLVNVQQVLALWAEFAQKPESTHYFATSEEISSACSKKIIDYDESETDAILDFLTLKPEGILIIKNDPRPAEDVPVWEHNKRLMRFDIRPIIKIGDLYYWGPHSIDRSARIWIDIMGKNRLPSDIDAPKVNAILGKGHKDLEESLVDKIKEITLRHTKCVKQGVYPHKFDHKIKDIGDCDILAYLKDKNILLNIESKVIDIPHSNKDSGRIQRKIFGDIKKDLKNKKGDVIMVMGRSKYLEENGREFLAKLGWGTPALGLQVVSVFVTQIGFWWTKFPPIDIAIKFVEIRLLDDFISRL